VICLVTTDSGNNPGRLSCHWDQHFGVVGKKGGNSAEYGRLLAQSGANRPGHSCITMFSISRIGPRKNDPVDLAGVSMELVVAEFEGYIQVDHHAGQYAKSEAKNVDARGQFIPAETTQGKKQLVFYHNEEDRLNPQPRLDHFQNRLIICLLIVARQTGLSFFDTLGVRIQFRSSAYGLKMVDSNERTRAI